MQIGSTLTLLNLRSMTLIRNNLNLVALWEVLDER